MSFALLYSLVRVLLDALLTRRQSELRLRSVKGCGLPTSTVTESRGYWASSRLMASFSSQDTSRETGCACAGGSLTYR